MSTECEHDKVQWRPEIEAVGERIAEQAAHVDAATHRLLCDIRTFDEAAGWAHQGARSCAQWLVWRLGWSRGTAREHVRVATKLAELPMIDDALRRAEISYCKARAITRVATPQTEATLLEYARYSTGSQLEEICRKWHTVLRHDDDTRPKDDAERRHVRHYDTADGMVRVVATLHPEEAAMLLAAIERIAVERCRQRAGVDLGDLTDTGSLDAGAKQQPERSGARFADASDPAATAPSPGSEARSGSAAPPGVPASEGSQHEPSDTSAGSRRTADGSVATFPATSDSTRRQHLDGSTDACPPLPADARHGLVTSPGIAGQERANAGADEVAVPGAGWGTDVGPGRGTDAGTPGRGADAGLKGADTGPAGRGTDTAPADASTVRATGFDRADALVAIASDILRGARRERSPVELVVSVSAEALRSPASGTMGATDPSVPDPTAVGCFLDGTCISQHAVRRLACDCGVVGVVEDERGVPLSVGRRTRSIPGAMKRALLRRDRTCRFPGCGTRVFLEGHHITHWAEGGETALSNLLCLCTHHHRYVHEYGYEIRSGTGGEIEFVDDRGRPVSAHPSPAKPPRRGFEAIRMQNRELEVTRDAPPLAWGEDRIDYVLAIDGLVRAEQGRA
jgi:hypothetical protein